jgi:hypothetical protein
MHGVHRSPFSVHRMLDGEVIQDLKEDILKVVVQS